MGKCGLLWEESVCIRGADRKRGVTSGEKGIILSGGLGKRKWATIPKGKSGCNLSKWGHWKLSGAKLVGWEYQCQALGGEKREAPSVSRMGPQEKVKRRSQRDLG